MSLNGEGMRVAVVTSNGREYSFGVWQTSNECRMKIGGRVYVTKSLDCPFDETMERHGINSRQKQDKCGANCPHLFVV